MQHLHIRIKDFLWFLLDKFIKSIKIHEDTLSSSYSRKYSKFELFSQIQYIRVIHANTVYSSYRRQSIVEFITNFYSHGRFIIIIALNHILIDIFIDLFVLFLFAEFLLSLGPCRCCNQDCCRNSCCYTMAFCSS